MVSRLFEVIISANAPDSKVRVVRTWTEAAAWLHLDLKEAETVAVKLREGPSLT